MKGKYNREYKICYTHMTMAELRMILPQGPNCWIGDGAFRDRVRLKQKERCRVSTQFRDIGYMYTENYNTWN